MIERIKNESGYSLVEVIVAIMLLGLAIIPMVGMFDAGLRAAVLGGNYDKGRALANAKLDEARALSYSTLVARYPPVNGLPAGTPAACPPNPPDNSSYSPYQCTITTTYVGENLQPNPDARGMVRVDVRVRWDSGSKSFSTMGLKARGTQ